MDQHHLINDEIMIQIENITFLSVTFYPCRFTAKFCYSYSLAIFHKQLINYFYNIDRDNKLNLFSV